MRVGFARSTMPNASRASSRVSARDRPGPRPSVATNGAKRAAGVRRPARSTRGLAAASATTCADQHQGRAVEARCPANAARQLGECAEQMRARSAGWRSPPRRRASRRAGRPRSSRARDLGKVRLRHVGGDACHRRRGPASRGSGTAPSLPWPVMRCSSRAMSRWVSGMPSRAAAAQAAVMPGTTSTGDAGRAQALQLLAATAEDERVAALEPHHMRAGPRVLQDEAVDRRLAHRVPAAAFADVDPPRVAAGPRSSTRGLHQRVVEHHVGALEHTQRAQGQQFRIARPGADQARTSRRRDRAAVARRVQPRADQPFRLRAVAVERRRRLRAVDHRVPEPTARVPAGQGFCHTGAPVAAQRGDGGKTRRDRRLDPAAQVAGQRGGAAAGADRDGDRRAVDDRRHDEIGQRGTIHRVDQHAGRARRLRDFGGIVQRDDAEPRAGEVGGLEGARMERELAFVGHRLELVAWRLGDRVNVGAAGEQQADFCQRRVAAADHQHALAGQAEEDGERRGLGRPGVRQRGRGHREGSPRVRERRNRNSCRPADARRSRRRCAGGG